MMLSDTDNSTKCKTVLQVVDTTRKAGAWGPEEAQGSQRVAWKVLSLEGKGRDQPNKSTVMNGISRQEKGTAGGLNVTRGREKPSAGCKQGYLC